MEPRVETDGEARQVLARYGLNFSEPLDEWVQEIANRLLELDARTAPARVPALEAEVAALQDRVRVLELENLRKQAAIEAIEPYCKVKYGMDQSAVEAIQDEAGRRPQGYGLLRQVVSFLYMRDAHRMSCADDRARGKGCTCGFGPVCAVLGIPEEHPAQGTPDYVRLYGGT